MEIAQNFLGQDFVDFTVPRHRLGSPGLRLVKDVMTPPRDGGERNRLAPVL